MFKNAEKVISISGLCTNCKNDKTCNFVKDIKIMITNTKKVLDTELTVYSCDNYETEKDICPEKGICLSCKQEE